MGQGHLGAGLDPALPPPPGFYSCPLYVCPRRAAGFVLTLDLRAGAAAPETWAKRGAAALLSLDV